MVPRVDSLRTPTGRVESGPLGLPWLHCLISKLPLSPLCSLELKPEKTLEYGLPVTTKPNKQRQGLNPYGSFIQMAGNLRRWRVHTPTDHLVFSFQVKVSIAGNKQGAVRGFEIQGKVNWIRKNNSSILTLGGGWSLAVSWAVVISPRSMMAQVSS